MITCAPGAIPLIGPRSMPNSVRRGDRAARRGRGRVRPVAVGVARRADDPSPMFAELARLGSDDVEVRVRERVGADQLVVAGECDRHRAPRRDRTRTPYEPPGWLGYPGRRTTGAPARCRCRGRRRSRPRRRCSYRRAVGTRPVGAEERRGGVCRAAAPGCPSAPRRRRRLARSVADLVRRHAAWRGRRTRPGTTLAPAPAAPRPRMSCWISASIPATWLS